MKTLSSNTQILNIHYRQELTPDALNKIFYSLFTPGVIEGNFSFVSGSNSVTISSVSFLIHPQNQTDILVRIDTTEAITLTKTSPNNIYLIARYRWENANQGAEFLFVDDNNIVSSDVILIGLILDKNGKITALDYDTQERARLKAIQKDTNFPLIATLDGFSVGHEFDNIPISDGVINNNLNAEYFDGKDATQFAVSKELPIEVAVRGEEGSAEITTFYPTYPSWMNTSAVDLGEGVTAEYVMGQGIQPQDGITIPSDTNKIPVANGVLQRDLNAEFLDGYSNTDFAKATHTHTLDELIEGGTSGYYPILGVVGNLATSDSIEDNSIDYTKVERIAYDTTTRNKYQPIYETGSLLLSGYGETYVPFANGSINDARIILQKAPAAGEASLGVSGTEKRTARITEIGISGFKAKQMGCILQNPLLPTDYVRLDSDDAGNNQYYYFCIGNKV